MHDELVRAGIEGDPALLDPVLDVLTTLKQGWQEVSQQSSPAAPTATQTLRPAPFAAAMTTPAGGSGLRVTA